MNIPGQAKKKLENQTSKNQPAPFEPRVRGRNEAGQVLSVTPHDISDLIAK